MWEVMFECHKLQFQIISTAYNNSHARIAPQSELRRQITAYLEYELHSLSSSFSKWIGAQKSYLQAINGWLHKCVLDQKSSSRRKRRPQPLPLRKYGPPIYATCSVWLEKIDTLPVKDVTDSIKSLAGETARFLPHQEKNQGKGGNNPHITTSWKADKGSESAENLLRDDASEDWVSGLDRFRASLLRFLGQLNNFARSSVNLYAELRQAIEDSKHNNHLRRNSHSHDGHRNSHSQPQEDQVKSQSQV